MSNSDAASALLTAINFDRFAEIEARHNPDVTFMSFRGPTLHGSVNVGDWHREFHRDYADCSYDALETIEQDDKVACRATIAAKGYDWRPFTQRVVEVMDFEAGGVQSRRLYGMLRDVEFDKPANAAMDNALGYRGGSASGTARTAEALLTALVSGDAEGAKAQLHAKPALIDGVFGLASGPDAICALFAALPRPAFGVQRVTNVVAGEHDALVEVAIDPSRPRAAYWCRIVDGKVCVIEAYWMLREIGVRYDVTYDRDRHRRAVIVPI
ncbi:MAG: nuclear transport factor 2 family protein [Dehalococcoidia bacterium]